MPTRRPSPHQVAAPLLRSKSALALLLGGLLALSAPSTAAGQETGHDHGEIGVVDFRASCDPGVQDDFDHAVALLHHMMYQQARQAFAQIAEQHPECAIAHWGIATTLFQPLWPARPDAKARQRGWEAVQRTKEHGALTGRERALVSATHAFFQDPEKDEWWPRIRRWASAMEEAYRQHPDDAEIAAFYALSQLAVGQIADDRAAHNARAAEVLANIHQEEPLHPGASHYTIHANDIAGRAGESPEIVQAYDEIAPSVPHALHMPSHIHVRLGEWPQVIEWNRKSAEAALRFPAGDRVSLHHAHALDYLLYARLQRGEDAKASSLLEELRSQDQPYEEGFISAYHLAVTPARYAVERRAWEEAVSIQPRAPEYLAWDEYWWPEALSWFAQGLGAVHTDDLMTARTAEQRMAELRDRARTADEAAFAASIEIDRLILSGRIAQAEGDTGGAVARMEEAAALEQTVEKNPVAPGALLPPYEALGDLLLEQKRPREAWDAYEESLTIWPNRYRSLLGAARAARAAGQTERARQHYERLLEITAGADTDRSSVQEAREFVNRVPPGFERVLHPEDRTADSE